jgi:oxygen-independent coproporphyrinogen-3 oxidase
VLRVDLPRHVYVHVPFCARRCSYCDFSIAVRRTVPVNDYVAAVRAELGLRFQGVARDEWVVDTLYFGGGTPSKLGAGGVSRLLGALRETLTLARDAEVTLEANPEDITREAVTAWREAGVTRLSIGAQSFDDAVLTWMHRTHDAAAIAGAVDAARSGGLDDFSLDLIFALPEQLNRDWETDIGRAIALEPSHLSLYGLTIEPRTPLGRGHQRGELIEAPDERYEREFLLSHQALASAGFDHYEVSNFARPGHRARHNSSYWTGVAYAGLGPSAHEFDGSVRRWNVEPFVEWARLVAEGRDPVGGSERLDEGNRASERIYLGLRTSAGLAADPAELAHASTWIEAGWATLKPGDRLVLTPRGWLRMDALAAALTLVRSH